MHTNARLPRLSARLSKTASLLLGAMLSAALLTHSARPARATACHPVTNFLVWFRIDDVDYRPGAEANIFNTSAVELRAKVSRDGGRTFYDVSCSDDISAVASGNGVVEVGGTGSQCPNELEYEPDESDIGTDVHIYVHFKDECNGTTQTGTLHLKVHGEP